MEKLIVGIFNEWMNFVTHIIFYTFLDILNDNKNIKYSLLFLDIIGRTMKLLLLVVICIVIFGAFNAEARIMGGGGGMLRMKLLR